MSDSEADLRQTKILSTQEIVRELLEQLRDRSLAYKAQVLWYVYSVVISKKIYKFIWSKPVLRFFALPIAVAIPALRRTIRTATSFTLHNPAAAPQTTEEWILEIVNVVLLTLISILSVVIVGDRLDIHFPLRF